MCEYVNHQPTLNGLMKGNVIAKILRYCSSTKDE